MDSPLVILIPLFLIGFLVLAIYGIHRAAKRREAFMQLALEYRLEFDPHRVGPDHPGYANFEIFHTGHSRSRYNTLDGQLEVGPQFLPIRAGDYRYKTTSGSGKNRRTTTHTFSYLLLRVPYRTADVRIRPEHIFDRFASAIGFNDLDFESVEFSDAFHVSAGDERFAYDLLHPPMLELLLRTRPPGVRLSRGWLLVSGGGTWGAEAFRRNIDFARQFIETWPRHLIASQPPYHPHQPPHQGVAG